MLIRVILLIEVAVFYLLQLFFPLQRKEENTNGLLHAILNGTLLVSGLVFFYAIIKLCFSKNYPVFLILCVVFFLMDLLYLSPLLKYRTPSKRIFDKKDIFFISIIFIISAGMVFVQSAGGKELHYLSSVPFEQLHEIESYLIEGTAPPAASFSWWLQSFFVDFLSPFFPARGGNFSGVSLLFVNFYSLIWYGLVFYLFLHEFLPCTSKLEKCLSIGLLLFSMFAYPWNSVLYGYLDLINGVSLALTAWLILYLVLHKRDKSPYFQFLLCFTGLNLLWCSPFFFLLVWVGSLFAILADYKNTQNKNLICILLFSVFLLSFALGVWPFLFSFDFTKSNLIYQNLYGNSVFFIPFCAYGIWCSWKNQESHILRLAIAFPAILLLFEILLFPGDKTPTNIYFIYYLMWPFIISFTIWGAHYLYKTQKTFVLCCCMIYCLLVTVKLSGAEKVVREKYPALDPRENIGAQFDIYESNLHAVTEEFCIFDEADIAELRMLAQFVQDNSLHSIAILGTKEQGMLFESFISAEIHQWKSWEYGIEKHLYRSQYAIPFLSHVAQSRPEGILMLGKYKEMASSLEEMGYTSVLMKTENTLLISLAES